MGRIGADAAPFDKISSSATTLNDLPDELILEVLNHLSRIKTQCFHLPALASLFIKKLSISSNN